MPILPHPRPRAYSAERCLSPSGRRLTHVGAAGRSPPPPRSSADRVSYLTFVVLLKPVVLAGISAVARVLALKRYCPVLESVTVAEYLL
jgi:hypothetical protein